MCHVKKSHDDDMSHQKSLILYVFCFIFPCLNQRINLVWKYDMAASESETELTWYASTILSFVVKMNGKDM